MTETNQLEPPNYFAYRPLDSSKREIRLFHMNPISSSGIITGTIVHVSLDNEFDCDTDTCYDTISYCWGDSTLSSQILVDGAVLIVTDSAEHALRTMCLSEEVRRIWIDSLCINQTSLEERSQQVQIMGEIYRQGCLNLINLGNEDEPILARAIPNIKAIYEEIRTETTDFADFESCVFSKTDQGIKYWTTSSIPLKTPLDVEALTRFFSRPWFYRLWVVQEAILADANFCHCGDYEIDLSQVMKVAVWLAYKSYSMPASINSTVGISNTTLLWLLAEHKIDPDLGGELETVLEYTAQREATDLRDKLYGILGLTRFARKEEKIPSLIVPDYTLPLNRVIQDLTRFIIRDSKDLRYFRNIDHSDGGPSLGTCSWQMPLEKIQHNTGKANAFP